MTHVDSEGTVFRSNHASNYISLAGNLNRDISVMLEKISEKPGRSHRSVLLEGDATEILAELEGSYDFDLYGRCKMGSIFIFCRM